MTEFAFIPFRLHFQLSRIAISCQSACDACRLSAYLSADG